MKAELQGVQITGTRCKSRTKTALSTSFRSKKDMLWGEQLNRPLFVGTNRILEKLGSSSMVILFRVAMSAYPCPIVRDEVHNLELWREHELGPRQIIQSWDRGRAGQLPKHEGNTRRCLSYRQLKYEWRRRCVRISRPARPPWAKASHRYMPCLVWILPDK